MSHFSSLLTWSGAFVFTSGVARIIQFVAFSILAANLSLESFASFGLMYSFATLVATFTPAGIGERTIAALKQGNTETNRRVIFQEALNLCVILSMFYLVLLFVGGWLYLEAIYLEDILKLLSALGIGVLMALGIIQGLLYRLQNHMLHALVVSNLLVIFVPVGMILGVLLTGKVLYVFASGLMLGLIAMLFFFAAFRVKLKIFLPRHMWGILKELFPYKVIASFGWVSGYGINALVVFSIAPEMMASYTFLITISSLAQLLCSSMNSVWMPKFVSIYGHKPNNLTSRYNFFFFSLQTLVVSVASIVVIIAIDFIPPVSEQIDFYLSQPFYLSLLFAAYVLTIPWHNASLYFVVNKLGHKMMRVTLLAGSIGIISWVGFVIYLGEPGLYWGFLFNVLIKSLCLWLLAKKTWELLNIFIVCVPSALLVIVVGYAFN